MNLLDLIHRTPVPEPWAEGDNIPWNEPDFSERMLREHLSQDHDLASRRFAKIDAHVDWIHRVLLKNKPSRILDLGCGPGLYSTRLARLGHTCVGIDFSPASIRYARETAEKEALACTFQHEDIRTADYGSGYDLAMLIFGEFSVFCPEDAKSILCRMHEALNEGGQLLLEPIARDYMRQEAQTRPTWNTSPGGLFSEQPHILLTENFWNETQQTLTTRHHIIDAASGAVTRYAVSYQAYTDKEMVALLEECGLSQVTFSPSLTGEVDKSQASLFGLLARKLPVADSP